MFTMEFPPSVRASDADRERVAERLRHATSEGRLTGDELEERLEALYASRTYGDLDALVADLPVARSPVQPALRIRRWVGAVGVAALVLGVLSMLALTRLRSGVAVVGGGHFRHLNLPGLLADPHRGLVLAASTGVAVLVLLASGVAVLWALTHLRTSRGR